MRLSWRHERHAHRKAYGHGKDNAQSDGLIRDPVQDEDGPCGKSTRHGHRNEPCELSDGLDAVGDGVSEMGCCVGVVLGGLCC